MQEVCTYVLLKGHTTSMDGKTAYLKMPILSKVVSTLNVMTIKIPKGFYFWLAMVGVSEIKEEM